MAILGREYVFVFSLFEGGAISLLNIMLENFE